MERHVLSLHASVAGEYEGNWSCFPQALPHVRGAMSIVATIDRRLLLISIWSDYDVSMPWELAFISNLDSEKIEDG